MSEMSGGMLIGYARCSTDDQDLTVQREALAGLGVTPERIYMDHGLTGTNRDRPGLRQALAVHRHRHRGRRPRPRDVLRWRAATQCRLRRAR